MESSYWWDKLETIDGELSTVGLSGLDFDIMQARRAGAFASIARCVIGDLQALEEARNE